jgi:uncharacterized membrane protein (DUF441 family)
MTWSTAWAKGLAIVVYFVATTVWLPHRILGFGLVRDAPELVSDLIVVTVWGAALFGGVAMLRLAQERGII